MATAHSDWMFLNGGSLERIEGIIERVRQACRSTGRRVRFALYTARLIGSPDTVYERLEAYRALGVEMLRSS